MNKNRRGRGKGFRPEEDREIRLALSYGAKVPDIAARLGRGRSSVFLRIKRMKETGEIAQAVMDLGALGADHDRNGR